MREPAPARPTGPKPKTANVVQRAEAAAPAPAPRAAPALPRVEGENQIASQPFDF